MNWRPTALLALLAACKYNPLIGDTRTPADFAHEVVPRCQGSSEQDVAPLLSPDSVDSVEPAMSYVQSGSGGDREARLRGARILLRPAPGMSRETLTRSLECHESRVVLGAVAPGADDPYSLPDRWLDIDVDSERDGFVVLVRIDEFQDARRVLDRAKSFGARRAR
jgi:hypothetical protein